MSLKDCLTENIFVFSEKRNSKKVSYSSDSGLDGFMITTGGGCSGRSSGRSGSSHRRMRPITGGRGKGSRGRKATKGLQPTASVVAAKFGIEEKVEHRIAATVAGTEPLRYRNCRVQYLTGE